MEKPASELCGECQFLFTSVPNQDKANYRSPVEGSRILLFIGYGIWTIKKGDCIEILMHSLLGDEILTLFRDPQLFCPCAYVAQSWRLFIKFRKWWRCKLGLTARELVVGPSTVKKAFLLWPRGFNVPSESGNFRWVLSDSRPLTSICQTIPLKM